MKLPFRSLSPRASATLGLIIIASAALGLYGSYRLNLRPAASTGKSQTFVITSGERSPQVATRLRQTGLIRSRNTFLTYLNLHGLRAQIKAGTYTLSPTESTTEIALTLTGGQSSLDKMVVPEGYRLSQIETLAASHGIQQRDFEAALGEPHNQSFLTVGGKPANVSLEGYLFPDTYEVTPQTTASQLVNAMLDNFGRRVGPDYTQAFAAEGLTLHQGLTLASMVEREVSNEADRPIVAQVFLKRYHQNMSLGSDVTTQYASDLANVPFNLDISSPYNTRKYVGLPPGPICNPGLSALDAVARPAATSYLYFYAGTDGKTYFATTLEEHNRNIALHSK